MKPSEAKGKEEEKEEKEERAISQKLSLRAGAPIASILRQKLCP